MTEEKKDDLNEQQTFLSGHEELPESSTEKKDEPVEQPEKPEPAEVAPEVETAEAEPEAKEEPEQIAEAEVQPEKPEPAEVEPEVETAEAEPEQIAAAEEQPEEAEATEVEPEVEIEEAKPEPEPEPEPKQAPETKAAPPAPAQKTGPKTLGGKRKKKAPQHPHQHTDRDADEEQRHKELLKHQELEQQEVTEVLAFLKKYMKPTAIVIAVICALVLANGFLKSQRLKKETMADTALMHAQSAEDLQAIVDDYASTPSEPFALMALAREKFNSGKIDEAEALYTKFTQKHGSHELASQAELNLVSCKEAKGQQDEASRLYGEFAKGNEGSYLVPSAMMSQARCLETLGKLDEAQVVYEDILSSFPESSWARLADINLKTVHGKKK